MTAVDSESINRKATKFVSSLRSQWGRYPRLRFAMTSDALPAIRWKSWLRISCQANAFAGAYRARRSGEPRYPGASAPVDKPWIHLGCSFLLCRELFQECGQF